MLLSCVIIQAQKKCWWNLKHDKFQADKTIGHFLFLFSFFSVHILVCWAEKQESACCFRKESTLMGFNRWFRKSKFFETACSVLIYACVYGYFLLSLTSACFSYNHWLLMVGLDFFIFCFNFGGKELYLSFSVFYRGSVDACCKLPPKCWEWGLAEANGGE